MAKGRIEGSQIVAPGLFDQAKKDAAEFGAEVKRLEKNVNLLSKSGAKLKDTFSGPSPKNVKSLKEFNKNIETASMAFEQRIKLNERLVKAQEKEMKAREHLKKLQADQRKALRDEVALMNKNIGTLEKARVGNRKLRRERENLNLATKEGRARLKEINAVIDHNNRIIEKNSDRMKKQRLGIGRYAKAVNGLRGALAKLGIAFGAFSLVRDSFSVIGDFQQATANLRSVLRDASEQEMQSMIDQAKELGATSRFTASQIAELQLEFGKLGFDPNQILNMTEATQNLAAATGTELAEAASVVGGNLNAFGLEAQDTQMLVDVMAKSFTKSALDMEKFKETMKTAGPIARATGVSLNDATAAAGKLADANISGSKAGTDLKNIFSALVKDGKPFKESLEDIAGKMNKASSRAERLAIAEDLVGEKAKASLLVLVDQREALGELSGELDNAGGTAKNMAEDQLKTLNGALDLLRSAWEGLILKMDEAGGVGETLRHLIGFLAENLETIVIWVGKAIRAFIIYKTTLAAMKLKDRITEFVQVRKAIKESGEAAGKATSSTKAFGAALKGIGLSLAITLLVELASAIWDYASGAEGARKQQELFNKAVEKGNEQLAKLRSKTAEGYQEEINDINRLRSLNQISEKEAVKRRKAAQEARRAEIKGQIDSIKLKYADLEATRKQQVANKKKFKNEQRWYDFIDDVAAPINSNEIVKEEKLAGKVRKTAAQQKRLRTILKGLREDYKNVGQEVFDTQNEMNEMDNQGNLFAGTAKKINTEFKNQIDLLDVLNDHMTEYASILNDIDQSTLDAQIASMNDEIEEATAMIQMLAEEGVVGDMAGLEKMMNERNDLMIQKIEEARDFEISTEQTAHALKFADMKKALEKERDELLKQEGIKKKDKEKIEANYQEELRKLEAIELSAQEILEAKIVKIKNDANNQIIEIERNGGKEIIDVKNQVNDALINAEQKRIDDENKKKDEQIKKDLKRKKEAAKREQDIIKATTEYLVKQIDARINKINEQIDASKSELDFLKQKAAEGNIAAQESLAEEKQLIDEANREKARLEKEKQNILLVSSILQSYNAELAAGATSDEAFVKAITSTTLLQTFIGGLGSFYEGTEDTGSTSSPLDSNGGRLAILHDNERVLTKKQNQKIGSISNEELANIAEQHRLGRLAGSGAKQIGSSWESAAIVSELMNVGEKIESVSEAIEQIETPSLEVGRVTQYSLEILERRKKGNRTTTNVFKVKGR